MSSDGGSNNNNERERPATENSRSIGDDDDTSSSSSVIGLNVGGKVFFTQRFTLTNGSSYFKAKFSGNFHSSPSYIDSQTGWKVYFVDADPVIFEIILNYLRMGVRCWPSPQDDKDNDLLHRRLLCDAQYFGIDSMVQALPRHFCPNPEGKGVMYWLGTERGVSEYRNPYELGAVQFSGTCKEQVDDMINDGTWDADEARKSEADFVGYRPLCDFHFQTTSVLLYCDFCGDGEDLIISLPDDILVRPSHYSLRYGEGYGMSDWNFEGSTDKSNWDRLHSARNDKSLLLRPLNSNSKFVMMKATLDLRCNGVTDENEKRAIATDIVEEHARHTWEVQNTHGRWYRHFRITGEGEDLCFVGFEIYGTVIQEDEE